MRLVVLSLEGHSHVPAQCLREVQLLDVPHQFVRQCLFQIACIKVDDLAESVHVGFSNAGTHAGSLGFRAEFLTENVPLQPSAEVVLDDALHDIEAHRSRLDHLKLVSV